MPAALNGGKVINGRASAYSPGTWLCFCLSRDTLFSLGSLSPGPSISHWAQPWRERGRRDPGHSRQRACSSCTSLPLSHLVVLEPSLTTCLVGIIENSWRDGSVGRALPALAGDRIRFSAPTGCGSQLSWGNSMSFSWSSKLWHTHSSQTYNQDQHPIRTK